MNNTANLFLLERIHPLRMYCSNSFNKAVLFFFSFYIFSPCPFVLRFFSIRDRIFFYLIPLHLLIALQRKCVRYLVLKIPLRIGSFMLFFVIIKFCLNLINRFEFLLASKKKEVRKFD